MKKQFGWIGYCCLLFIYWTQIGASNVTDPGYWALGSCTFDTINTANATIRVKYCVPNFNICSNHFITASTCYHHTGDTFIRLKNSSVASVAYSNDGCGESSLGSYLKYETVSACQKYSVSMGCYQNTACSGNMEILVSAQDVIYGGFCSFIAAIDPTFLLYGGNICYANIPMYNPCDLDFVSCEIIGNSYYIVNFTAVGVGIEGTLPISIDIPNLKVLNLSGNNLHGNISSTFTILEGLESLDLSRNKVSGPIPEELGSLTNLESFSLSNNPLLHGSLPSDLFLLPKLRHFSVSQCQISGKIPETINLPNLIFMDISYNQIYGNIPLSISELPSLEELNLNSNNFSGPFLESVSLNKIIALDIGNNFLSGEISDEISSMTFIQELTLANNSFNSSIPTSLGLLSNLRTLALNQNSFSGPIPSEIGRLTNLFFADFSQNDLTGMIPSSIASIPSAVYLNFGFNPQLVGQVPTTICSNAENFVENHQLNLSNTGVDCYDSCFDDMPYYIHGKRTCSAMSHELEVITYIFSILGGLMFVSTIIYIFVTVLFGINQTEKHTTEIQTKENNQPVLKRSLSVVKFCDVSSLPPLKGYYMLIMNLIKFIIALALAFLVNSGWKNCDASDQNDIITSCRTPSNTLCKSYCENIIYEYGTAEAVVSNQCACTHWKKTSLGPVVLIFVQLIIQILVHTVSGWFDPYEVQFRVLSDPVASIGLMASLCQPAHVIFPALEAVTLAVLWAGAVLNPLLHCQGYFPFYLLIFPVVITVFESFKFNVYMAIKQYSSYDSILYGLTVLFRLDTILIYGIISFFQAISFVITFLFLWPLSLGWRLYFNTIHYYSGFTEKIRSNFDPGFVKVGSNILIYGIFTYVLISIAWTLGGHFTVGWLIVQRVIESSTLTYSCYVMFQSNYGLRKISTDFSVDNFCPHFSDDLQVLIDNNEIGWTVSDYVCDGTSESYDCKYLDKVKLSMWVSLASNCAMLVISIAGAVLEFVSRRRKQKDYFKKHIPKIACPIIIFSMVHFAASFSAVSLWRKQQALICDGIEAYCEYGYSFHYTYISAIVSVVVIGLCICILEVEYRGNFFSEIWTSLIMLCCKEKEKIVYQKVESKKHRISNTHGPNDSVHKIESVRSADSVRSASEANDGALEQIEMVAHHLA